MDAAPFKKWWREPLLHFLLLGALIFLLSSWKEGPSSRAGRIVVTRARIEELEKGFVRTWQRPPTAAELSGLIEEDVRDEVSVREAVAAGVDWNDPILRRRLRRKLELANEESVEAASPSDADLEAYLKAHPESAGAPKETIEREWRAAQKRERNAALFRRLLARYEVVEERPAATGSSEAGGKTP